MHFSKLPSGKVHPDDISEAIKCECSKYSIVSFLGRHICNVFQSQHIIGRNILVRCRIFFLLFK